jgi:RNA polymerase sigma factor (sigma-70 family)
VTSAGSGTRRCSGPGTAGTEPPDTPGPDEAAAADLRVSVAGAVAGLPRRLREAVVLRFYAGLREAEMAAVLGVPSGTVKSRLARARRHLAGELGSLKEER